MRRRLRACRLILLMLGPVGAVSATAVKDPPGPAKLAVKRAAVTHGRLDVLAAVAPLAKGRVSVSYRSAGTTTAFSATIKNGRSSITKLLPPAQRRKRTGIVTLTYPGSASVRSDSVRLRAARRQARLRLAKASIDDLGTLRVSGTISARARGNVRVRLSYTEQSSVFEIFYKAPIIEGRWFVESTLPRAAAVLGGELSIRFTGYGRRRIRGEQLAKQVMP